MVNRSWYTNRLTDAWKTNRRQIWLKVLLLCICYVGEKIRTRKSTIQMDVGTFSKICKWVSFVFRWWWLEMLGWKSSTRIHLGDKSWNTNSLWGNMWISTWLWNIWFRRKILYIFSKLCDRKRPRISFIKRWKRFKN